MGDGMARNLLEGGRDLIVWNRTGSKAADFSQETGCETAKTPKEVREKMQGSERHTARQRPGWPVFLQVELCDGHDGFRIWKFCAR